MSRRERLCREAEYTFGAALEALDPDGIWDFVMREKGRYPCVLSLDPLPSPAKTLIERAMQRMGALPSTASRL